MFLCCGCLKKKKIMIESCLNIFSSPCRLKCSMFLGENCDVVLYQFDEISQKVTTIFESNKKKQKLGKSNWQHNHFLFVRFSLDLSFRTKWKEKHKEIDKNKLKFPFSHTISMLENNFMFT